MRGYPKIVHYGSKDMYLEDLAKGKVVAEEKIDGSLLRVRCNGDERLFGSKNIVWDAEHPLDGMFAPGVIELTKLLSGFLPQNSVTIYGEYLAKPRQNTLSYERVPKHNFVVFDVLLNDPQHGEEWSFMGYGEKKQFSESLDLEVVQLLEESEFPIINLEKINTLLQKDSMLGKEKIEGIVFKNYGLQRTDRLFLGEPVFAKYVRPEFKERNDAAWRTSTKKGFMEALVERHASPARWAKAMFRLRDDGKLTWSPRDIPEIMKEVMRDLKEEEGQNIQIDLFEHFWRDICKGIVRGIPEWYQAKLIEESTQKPTEPS